MEEEKKKSEEEEEEPREASRGFIATGSERLRAAVQADREKDFEKALALYLNSFDLLLKGLACTT